MKKPKRSTPLASLQSAVYEDLTAHIMVKVAYAATDVVQLVDTMDEALSLYRSAMVALLTETILRTAPPGTSRAELLLGAQAINLNLSLGVTDVLEELTDDEIERLLARRQGD